METTITEEKEIIDNGILESSITAPSVVQDSLPAASDDNPYIELQRAAIAAKADQETLKYLVELYKEFEAQKALRAYNAAFTDFQMACPVIKKVHTADFIGRNGAVIQYKYADAEDIVEQVGDLLAMCGLNFRFEQATTESGAMRVKCILTHVMGHSEACISEGPIDNSGCKNILQGICSSNTYLRRYSLTGVLGIVTGESDHDGQLLDDNEFLEENSIYKKIENKLKKSKTLEELKKHGKDIASLIDGSETNELKKLYHTQRQELKNGERS